MREGAQTTGNITQSSTGFIKLASGTTAQRPTNPVAGMLRFNTDTGASELYNGTAWVNTGGTFQVATVTGADNATSEPMLFLYDSVRQKWLSDSAVALPLFANSVYNDDWIFYDASVSSDVGYIAPYPGTMTMLSAYSSNPQTPVRRLSIYVGATEYANQLALSPGGTTTPYTVTNSDININFAAGSNIRFRVRWVSGANSNTRPMTNVVITAYMKWRL